MEDSVTVNPLDDFDGSVPTTFRDKIDRYVKAQRIADGILDEVKSLQEASALYGTVTVRSGIRLSDRYIEEEKGAYFHVFFKKTGSVTAEELSLVCEARRHFDRWLNDEEDEPLPKSES